jgi:exopolysaccharide biosynthesis polyprenyl glycosylphosphotransferase
MSRRQNLSKDLQMILDGFLCGIVLWVVHMARYLYPALFSMSGKIPDISTSYWMIALVIPSVPLLLDLNGLYDNPLSQKYEVLFGKMVRAGFWLFVLLSAVSIFAKLEIPSRWVLLVFIVAAPAVVLLRIVITRHLLIRSYRSGRLGERTVIVGAQEEKERFLRGLTPWERLELQIVQTYDPCADEVASIHRGIRQHAAGRVIFTSVAETVEALPAICEAEGLEVWILSSIIHGIAIPPAILRLGSNRILSFRKTNPDFWYTFLKRVLDIVGSITGLVLFLPAGILIAAAIKMDSPGPVIFRQERSGRHGRRFTMYKFRSMVRDAPDRRQELSAINEMSGPVFKISGDPRITKVGRFLRRTSLDELPQFLNILRGEMSLVGPRPLPDYETEQIDKSVHRRRLSVKPGLTCLWQVRGRNTITNFDDWVRMDIEYIDRASLSLDCWLIVRTIPALLFSSGAR